MKAWVLHGINDLRYEEVTQPKPGKQEVLVQVRAAGICGSDVPRVFWEGAHRMPLIIGHEFSGQVVQLGPCVDDVWLHKRVGVFPLIPCGTCIACKRKHYELCRNYSYLGSRCDGGFAEYVTVRTDHLIALPENVSYEKAAMLEPMAVAVHAMRRSTCKQSDSVVIIGLGTIGLLLLMFLKEAGIQKIFVVGNKASQKEKALSLGVLESAYCDIQKSDVPAWILEHTDGNGADVLFECVGRNETYAWAVAGAAPMGRVVTVGNPASDMTLSKTIYWKILRNQLQILGTWNSSFTGEEGDDWHYVIKRLQEGTVRPECLISHRLPLDELAMGLHIMKDKTEDYTKVMLIPTAVYTDSCV